jgi:hypothetical protein
MDAINQALEPLTKLFPEPVQDFLTGGGWLGVFAFVLLVLVLLGWALVRRRRPRPEPDWDKDFRVNLEKCPLPVRPPGERRLTVYHVPVRLRLVVVAPVGTFGKLDATAVEKFLERVVPGLGVAAQEDRPRIKVWPQQLSHHGFAAIFHRCTLKPEPEGDPSRWVLLAGRAHIGKQPLLLGLGAWADEPNNIGRLNLEPHQWIDVVRLERAAELP